MNADVYNIEGKQIRKMELPKLFNNDYREDLVRRAIHAEQSLRYQPQGHYLLAGFQTTAVYVGTYSGYRSGRHKGIAIRPRQKLAGGAMGDVRRIPSSTKGHRAHPHKIEKRLAEGINAREYRKALESAVAGTAKEMVRSKHIIEKQRQLPIIVEDGIEELSKAKDVYNMLKNLGLEKDIEESKKPRLRKGLARSSRNRRFRNSVLIVVNGDRKVNAAGRNIAGVDVCSVNELRAEKLAPGATPRITVWSESAVKNLEGAISKAELGR